MQKINKILVGLGLITQLITTSNVTMASSGDHIGNCTKDDAIIITAISAGIVVLEKIAEKIYKCCMAKYKHNDIQQPENNGNTDLL